MVRALVVMALLTLLGAISGCRKEYPDSPEMQAAMQRQYEIDYCNSTRVKYMTFGQLRRCEELLGEIKSPIGVR
jgi:hypothetical protein